MSTQITSAMLGEVSAGDGVAISTAETSFLLDKGECVSAEFGPSVFKMKRSADNAVSAVRLMVERCHAAEAAGAARNDLLDGLEAARLRGEMADYAFDHISELAPVESDL